MHESWHFRDPLHAIRSMEVDGGLLLSSYGIREVRLPFAPAATLRMGPGALLLASAVTVAAEQAESRHWLGLLDAVRPLGFTQETFLKQRPVIRVVEHGFIVQDGKGQRAYFVDAPAALFAACANVYDGKERPITPEDAALLPPDTPNQYAFAMAEVTNGQIGPLTYLGSLALAASIADAPLRELAALGLPIAVVPTPIAPEHADTLRRLSTGEAKDPVLHIGPSDRANVYVPAGQDWPQTVIQAILRSRKKRRMALCIAAGFLLFWLVLLILFLMAVSPADLLLAALFCLVDLLLGGLIAKKLFTIFR